MIGFGSIGGGEVIMILGLALLLFGPRKIPQVSRTIGKTLAEFRKATSDLKQNLEREIDMEGIREAGKEIKAVRSDLASVAGGGASLPTGSRPEDDSQDPPTGDKAENDTARPAKEEGPADKE